MACIGQDNVAILTASNKEQKLGYASEKGEEARYLAPLERFPQAKAT